MDCNRSCAFCFSRNIAAQDEMSIDAFDRFISLLTSRGIREIDIMGGEPTLHPHFIRMVEIIRNRQMRATISTNGYHNTAILAAVSARCHPEQVRIGISVNGGDIPQDLHGYITIHKPMLKSVYTKDWRVSASLRQYLGKKEMQYYLLFMDTVQKEDLNASVSFPEFYQAVQDLKRTYENLDSVSCGGFIPDVARYPFLDRVRCPAGTTKLSVMPDGSVYPCYLFFRNAEYCLGNILHDDFSEIWNHRLLNFFRHFTGNACACKECELFSLCHGGCPAVSLLITHDITASDPRCAPLT